MASRQITVSCAGCGSEIPSVLIKNQVRIPHGWLRLNLRRLLDDGRSEGCGQVHICSAACATPAVVGKFPLA